MNRGIDYIWIITWWGWKASAQHQADIHLNMDGVKKWPLVRVKTWRQLEDIPCKFKLMRIKYWFSSWMLFHLTCHSDSDISHKKWSIAIQYFRIRVKSKEHNRLHQISYQWIGRNEKHTSRLGVAPSERPQHQHEELESLQLQLDTSDWYLQGRGQQLIRESDMGVGAHCSNE